MTDVVRARVHIGTTEIAYLRAGKGPVAVLLGCTEGDVVPAPDGGPTPPSTASPLLAALSAAFRVIVPLIPPPREQEEGERWIQGLIDGLGLDRPALVVDSRLAPLVNGFVRRDPQRVGVVVLLPEDEEGEVQISTILPLLLGRAAAP